MDLQGVGALAAAGVAAASVPVVLIVGRWQLRATLNAADAARRVGNDQAQATYSAALDAVTAQATATHSQWRRGTKRDAYAALLLADHQLREITERLLSKITADRSGLDELMAEANRTKAAMRAAYVVVDLEGPSDLAATADSILTHAFLVTEAAQREAVMERAWHQLVQMSEGNWLTGGTAAVSRDRARTFMECLVRLQVTIAAQSNGDDTGAGSAIEYGQRMSEVFASMGRVGDELTQRDRAVLLDMHLQGRPRLRADYEEWVDELKRARTEFVLAARAELGDHLGAGG
ncbi:hypothetical protein ACFWR6_06635 [Streptomyces griseus]|uniref:hypothetical protein n=1 Tax=Streptomyces griseus TaxID=1911 RepID=UPI0036581168